MARARSRVLMVAGLLLAGVLAGVIFAGAAAVSVHATNRTAFCTGCHVYDRFAEDFRQSTHWRNTAGVQVGCADCHVPGDSLANMLWVKARSGAQAYWAYYVRGIDTPAEFAERRAALQEEVHAWFKSTDSGTCRDCHAVESMRLAEQSPAARGGHQAAASGAATCVDCHSGVPHGHVEGAEGEAGGAS